MLTPHEQAVGRLLRAPRAGQWWVALTLFLFFEGTLIYRFGYRQEGLFHVDLPSFYLAATATFVDGASPYEYPALFSKGPSVQQHVFPFLYPPPSLLPLYPLHFLSYEAAKVATLVANHLLVLGVVLLFAFLVPFRQPELGLFVGAFLLSSDPVMQTLAHGQPNLAVLALLLLTWQGLRADRPVLSGASLAAAILIKPSPVVLLGYLVARRAWRTLAVALVLLIAALAMSVVVLPDGVWVDWLTKVRPTLAYGMQPADLFSPACNFNQSLNGFVARIFLEARCLPTAETVPWQGRLLTYALATVVLGASMVVTSRSATRTALDRGFCLFLLAMFLVGTLSWENHLVFVLPAVILLLSRQQDSPTRSGVLMLAVLGATLPLPIYHPALETGWLRLLVSTRTYAVVALWSLLLASLRSPRPLSVNASDEDHRTVAPRHEPH